MLDEELSAHYQHGSLLAAIELGLRELGITRKNLRADDLSAVEEFHVGGRQASIEFLDQLAIREDQHYLDIGCGIGGTARLLASSYKAKITGVDLSGEYIETGRVLCNWLGLEQKISLQQGNVLQCGFDDATFDGACMLHVGMNIQDKKALFKEVARVLKPGSYFGIYDVMSVGDDELAYPLPWASDKATSFVDSPGLYRNELKSAGFSIVSERNRGEFAIDFFSRLKKKSQAATKKPALGLHILMGESAALKVKNMVANISAERIAPYEIIACIEG
ncbi:MAG: methyltransferase domain-containing protein [Gammaproteobacteria bacterium]|nr:methyltransferase domain-containing protein [Gammaproteobacteria bacterium]